MITLPNANDFELDLSDLSSGNYFLQLSNGEKVKMINIIVQ